MRLLEHRITLANVTDELRIIPVGCVHADTEGFHEELWRECVEDIAKPNTFAILAGDYLDAVRTHARLAIADYRARGEDQWEQVDAWATGAYDKFYKDHLKKIRDKILVIGAGNHLWQFQDGTTSDQYLARLCGAPFGDKPTFLRLHVDFKGKTLKTFKVLIHHEGGGGGGYSRHGTDVGAAETKAYQFGAFDIVIFSHTHRKWGMLIPDLDLTTRGQLKTVERTRALIRTGCFTRSYAPQCMSHYAHKKLLPPTELGYVTLKIKFERGYDADKYARLRRQGLSPAQARNNDSGEFRYRFKVEF